MLHPPKLGPANAIPQGVAPCIPVGDTTSSECCNGYQPGLCRFAGCVGDSSGLVHVQLPAEDVAFIRGFHPDRDRSASRADMVRVIEHLQAALAGQDDEDGAR